RLVDAEAPPQAEDTRPGAQAELARRRGRPERLEERAHPLPVAQRLARIAHRSPLRCPPMPARRFEDLACGLPVIRELGGPLTQPLRVERGDRARDGGVHLRPACAEL